MGTNLIGKFCRWSNEGLAISRFKLALPRQRVVMAGFLLMPIQVLAVDLELSQTGATHEGG